MPKLNRKRSKKRQKPKKFKTAAPWGDMSFNAIINSETPETHQKKKRNSLKRSKRRSRMKLKIPE